MFSVLCVQHLGLRAIIIDLIGQYWSRDLNTGLSLVNTGHVTSILDSHWSIIDNGSTSPHPHLFCFRTVRFVFVSISLVIQGVPQKVSFSLGGLLEKACLLCVGHPALYTSCVNHFPIHNIVISSGETQAYTLGDIGGHRCVVTKLPMTGHSREASIASGSTTTRQVLHSQ